MIRSTGRSLRSLATLIAVGGALAACSDEDPMGPEEHVEPATAEVYVRGGSTRLADTHGDHWHGSVSMNVGDEQELDVRFLDADGDVIPLDDEHTVRAEIVAGQPIGIASVAAHGDHLQLTALAPGETRIVIHLWHDGHADWSTPPLRVAVTAP